MQTKGKNVHDIQEYLKVYIKVIEFFHSYDFNNRWSLNSIWVLIPILQKFTSCVLRTIGNSNKVTKLSVSIKNLRKFFSAFSLLN